METGNIGSTWCYLLEIDNFYLLENIYVKRYWVNEEFFDGTGPVFIMIGGEGEENPIWMENGQWINFAKQYVIILIDTDCKKITFFFYNILN